MPTTIFLSMSNNATPEQQKAYLEKWQQDANMWNDEIRYVQSVIVSKTNELEQMRANSKLWLSLPLMERIDLVREVNHAKTELNQILQEKQTDFINWKTKNKIDDATLKIAASY